MSPSVKTDGMRRSQNSEQRLMLSLRCRSFTNSKMCCHATPSTRLMSTPSVTRLSLKFPIYDPRTFLYPNIGVALGHAYPAAIGAKVAHPDRPVICFSGDGGFLMGAVEMATAMKYGINVVAVVVNDGALSAIKGSQQKGV